MAEAKLIQSEITAAILSIRDKYENAAKWDTAIIVPVYVRKGNDLICLADCFWAVSTTTFRFDWLSLQDAIRENISPSFIVEE